MSRAVMQQALDAIDHLCNTTAAGRYYEPKIVGDAVKALEAALAEPEPVIDKTMAKRIATQLGWGPAKKPLTDEEIARIPWIYPRNSTYKEQLLAYARAIERAHGIKEQEHE